MFMWFPAAGGSVALESRIEESRPKSPWQEGLPPVEATMPALSNFDDALFLENTVNGAAQLLDADVDFTDLEGDFDGGVLTLSGLLAEDRASVRNEGTGAGQIGLSGTDVTFGGVIIGTLAGGVGATLTITFNAAATSAAIDALIQNLTYANVSDAPTPSRDLVLNVTDAAGNDLTGASTFTQRTGAANPFNGVNAGLDSSTAFADLDGDGDLDALIGETLGSLSYFENTGTAETPIFTQRSGAANPFNGVDVGYRSSPTFADLDGDGDLDAVVGANDGVLNYFENTGTAVSPVFTQLTGAANPFNGADVGGFSKPTFADLDSDGDLDAVVGELDGALFYFENIGTALAPAFVERAGASNPFDGVDVGSQSSPTLADLDGDGDLDAIIGAGDGTLRYFENTGTDVAPTFTPQTGTANPFNDVPASGNSSPALADLDNDGDLDAVVGGFFSPSRYFENTTVRGRTLTVTVTAENDAPAATGLPTDVTVTEDVASDLDLSAVTLTDPDSTGPITVTLTASAGTMTAASGGGVTISNSGTGALTLTGTAAAIDACLNTPSAIQYTGALNASGDNAATVTVTADDGSGAVELGVVNIDITAVIDPPVLTGLTTAVTFAENTVNATPQLLDADVTFTDSDGDYDGGTLTITGLLAEDTLSVRNEGSGAGQIGLSGANVTFGGVIIGTLAGGAGSTLTITFNAAATSEAIDALIQNLTYANSSDTPTASRDLTINITDAAGNDLGAAGPAAFTERTGSANPFDGIDAGHYTAPTFADLNGDGDLDVVVGDSVGTLRFIENTGTALTPAFTLDLGATLSRGPGFDVGYIIQPILVDLDDDGDLDIVVGEQAGFLHYLENTGTTAAPVFTQRIDGANPFNGVDVGFYAAATFADLDDDGDLDAIISESDGSLLYFENTGSVSAPVFTERTGAANPFTGVNLGAFSRATFADVDGDNDLDAVVGELDGTLSYYENTGTAGAPILTERAGAANPFNGVAVAGWSVPALGDLDDDGDLDVLVGGSDGAPRYFENTAVRGQTFTVTITAQNDAPEATGLPTDVTVTEDVASDLDLSAITLTDPDTSGAITVALTASAGTLAAASGGGVTVSDSGTSVLTLEGTAADIDAFLNSASNITYTGAANAFGVNAATITVTANDGSGATTLGVVNVTITGVNDAPVEAANTGAAVDEDGTVVITTAMLDFDDAEQDDANITFTVTSVPAGGRLTLDGATLISVGRTFTQQDLVDGRITYVHDGGEAAADSFGFSVSDGQGGSVASQTFQLSINPVNDAPSFDTVTHVAGPAFIGDSAGDRFGEQVANAGDVDGDGVDDIIIGAPYDDANGPQSGTAIVISGATGDILHTFHGATEEVYFGGAVDGAGDVDGDGFADLIVGSPHDDSFGFDSGQATVFSGATGAVLYNLFGTSIRQLFGGAVSGVGDVNGDGFADFAVGTPFDHTNGPRAGSVTVYSGATGASLYTYLGTVSSTLAAVSSAGDINGDGIGDLIIGAWGADDNGLDSGTVRVLSGVNGAVLYTFTGDAAGDAMGRVAGAGDVDGDGRDDLIVGFPSSGVSSSPPGGARVISGATGATLFTFSGDAAGDYFGYSVAGAGDVNGDGHADLLVGAPLSEGGGPYSSGTVRVFSGATGEVLYSLHGTSYDWFGQSVAGAGDLNGDGLADFIVGAPFADTNGLNLGRVQVFLSSRTGSSLDANPTFTEGGAAVVLDADAMISDAELDAANSYAGAVLTLARSGGANAEDLFSGAGSLSLAGGDVVLSGVTVGTFVQSGGALTISFNAAATSARADQVLRLLTYSNISDAPPASVEIAYSFNDGDASSPGVATGAITVAIVSTNDAPTATSLPTDVTVTEDVASDLDLSAVTLADADVTDILTLVLTASAGTLAAASGGGVTVSNSGTGALTLTGLAADIDAFLNTASNIQYTGALNAQGDNAATVTVTADDGSGVITLGVVNIDITDVVDFLTGTSNGDSLFGTEGNDVIRGLAGNDHLQGRGGDDILSGGGGDDILNGGDGIDTADYWDAASGVTVKLDKQGGQNTLGAGFDRLIDIENLSGSAFHDYFTGDAGDNVLSDVLGGNDRFIGGGGNDILSVERSGGGAATSIILTGGIGDDVLTFDGHGRYIDTVTFLGQDGDDVVTTVGAAYSNIQTGAGNDTVTVDTLGGVWQVQLGSGSDTLILADTSGAFAASSTNRVYHFDTGNGGDVLDLTAYLAGGALTNYTPGSNPFLDGHMRLVQFGNSTQLQVDRDGGSNGYVTVLTLENTQALNFTAHNFNGLAPLPGSVEGGAGPDTLFGTGGMDVLNGNGGDDVLIGGAGADVLNGGSGNDLLDGGDGDDVLNGGSGAQGDTVTYATASAGVTVNLATSGLQNTGGSGFDSLSGIEHLIGSAFTDTLRGDGFANRLTDTLGGDDFLRGEGGNDTILISRSGGGAATTVRLNGGDGDDALTFNGNGRFSDTVTLEGGDGNDFIIVRGGGTINIDAGAGHDTVSYDTLGGNHRMTLGSGVDTVRLAGTGGLFAANADNLVRDFVTGAGGDIVDLSAYLAGGALTSYTASENPFGDGHMRLIQSGSRTLLQVDRDGGGNGYQTVLTFANTTVAAFTAANFNGLDPTGLTPAPLEAEAKGPDLGPQVWVQEAGTKDLMPEVLPGADDEEPDPQVWGQETGTKEPVPEVLPGADADDRGGIGDARTGPGLFGGGADPWIPLTLDEAGDGFVTVTGGLIPDESEPLVLPGEQLDDLPEPADLFDLLPIDLSGAFARTVDENGLFLAGSGPGPKGHDDWLF